MMEDPRRPVNEFAIASLVIGIVTFFNLLNIEKAIAAIIFGVLALRRIGRNEGARGKGLAIAGIVLGILAIIFILILITVVAPRFRQEMQA